MLSYTDLDLKAQFLAKISKKHKNEGTPPFQVRYLLNNKI